MKGCVNLNVLQIACDRLEDQVERLQKMAAQIRQIEKKVEIIGQEEGMKEAVIKSRKSLEAHINMIKSMIECLKCVQEEYRKTEEQVADRYNLEVIEYPKVHFAVSKITGMESFWPLMPFFKEGEQDGK